MTTDTPQSTGNTEFVNAATKVKDLGSKPSNDQLLQLYALFKQSIVGDNNTSKPAFYDLQGSAKWKAWEANKGMSKPDAQAKYIELVKTLLKADGKDL